MMRLGAIIEIVEPMFDANVLVFFFSFYVIDYFKISAGLLVLNCSPRRSRAVLISPGLTPLDLI